MQERLSQLKGFMSPAKSPTSQIPLDHVLQDSGANRPMEACQKAFQPAGPNELTSWSEADSFCCAGIDPLPRSCRPAQRIEQESAAVGDAVAAARRLVSTAAAGSSWRFPAQFASFQSGWHSALVATADAAVA